MSIQSNVFWMFFLPLSLLVYYRVKDRYKPSVLLIFSIVFHLCVSILHLLVFLVLSAVNIALGQKLSAMESGERRRKPLFITGVVLNAAVLVFYKYSGFLNDRLPDGSFAGLLVFPAGLSFFVFKAISFLTDIYRGKIRFSSDSITEPMAYLFFFGQFHSGPITRYSDMALQPAGSERKALFGEGVYRFMVGFSKKTLLANTLSLISTEIFTAETSQLSASYAWLGAVCWALELYYDFAGYSDMAIGVTNMFGMRCPENFIFPYTTESFSGFWRKWHVSLGSWFRDYVYIPLGGSRNKKPLLTYRNLLVVWLLTGFWHGITLNFILWGIGHFLFIALERACGIPKRLKSLPAKIIWRIVVLTGIVLLWVLFRCETFGGAVQMLAAMFGFGAQNASSNYRVMLLIRDYAVFLVPALVFTLPVVPALRKKCDQNQAAGVLWTILCPLCVTALFLGSLVLVVYGANNPFVYANF